MNTAAKAELKGCRVFVVEDEPLIAMLLEDMLCDAGCSISAIAGSLPEALSHLAANQPIDVALLDVRLGGGQTTEPVAAILQARACPIVFSTGYGAAGLPPGFADTPCLSKPFQANDVVTALASAITASRRSDHGSVF